MTDFFIFLFLIAIIGCVEIIILEKHFYDYYLLAIDSYQNLFFIFLVNMSAFMLIRLAFICSEGMLKEKIKNYNRLINWSNQIKFYLILLVLTFSLSHLIFINFKLLHTNPESARYLLSALIQSQAAIIAIVVSLTLVAVQLAASSYSKRIIDVFKKNPDFWIVLSLYGISIIYSSIVLKSIDDSDLELFISISIYFSIFTFIILFPFFVKILNILKPSTIIQELMDGITKQYIIKCNGYGKTPNDPFYPITDVFKDSLIKHDFDITRELLNSIRIKAGELTSPNVDENILNYFYFHIREIGKFAAKMQNDEIVTEILVLMERLDFMADFKNELNENRKINMIRCAGDIGQYAAKYGLDSATHKALMSIENVERELSETYLSKSQIFGIGQIGLSACEGKLDSRITESIQLLKGLGIRAAKERLNDLTSIIVGEILHIYRKTAEIEEFGYCASRSVLALKEICMISVENEFEDPVYRTAEYLGYLIGHHGVASEAAEALGDIGKVTIKNGYEQSTSKVIESLQSRIRLDHSTDVVVSESRSIRYLGEIGEIALEKRSELVKDILKILTTAGYGENSEIVLLDLVNALKKIGIVAAKGGCDKSFISVVRSLEQLGEKSIDGKFSIVFFKITDALIELSKLADENELKDEFLQTKNSLRLLMISAINKGFTTESFTTEAFKMVYMINDLMKLSFWNENKLKEANEISKDLMTIGRTAIKNHNEPIAIDAVNSISIDLMWIVENLDNCSDDSDEIITEKLKLFICTVSGMLNLGTLAADNKLEEVVIRVSFSLKEIIKILNEKVSEKSSNIMLHILVSVGVRSIKNNLDIAGETVALHLAELANLKLFVFNDFMKEQHSFYAAKGMMTDEFQKFKSVCSYYIDNSSNYIVM